MAKLLTGTRVYGTANVDNVLTVGSITPVNSTSNTTGALIVVGGVGILGNTYTGNLVISGSSAAGNGITFADGTRQTTAAVSGGAIDQYARDTANLSIGIDVTQNTRLNAVETINTNQNTSISIIQGVDATQNTQIGGIQGVDLAQNSAISIIQGVDATQNTSINTLNTQVGGIQGVDLAQNSAISIIQGVDLGQNATITAVNQFAGSAFNTANGANGLAAGAFNQANTTAGGLLTANAAIAIIQGVDLGQNATITAVNQFTQTAFNKANSSTSFQTIYVSGQPNIIANTANAGLTFVAGSGMTISTVGTSNTITFSSTGSGGSAVTSGFLANSVIFANTAGFLANTSNIQFFAANNNLVLTGNIVAGGARTTTSSSSPPSNPTVGDIWYNSSIDTTYRYTYDGVNNFWLDITGPSSVGTNVLSPISSGMRNRFINGAMAIDQRFNGGILFQSSGSTAYSVDRWSTFYTQVGAFNVQQNAGTVTPPAGFLNYLGATAQSSYAISAGDFFTLQQSIEGYNWYDMAWGTTSAKTVTMSFWVRSSLTGTFGGSLRNFDGTRSYPFTYTISAANTWEYKTITIPGDTSGTYQKTISIGVTAFFGLGVGSTFSGTAGSWSGGNFLSATGATSVVGTSGATFYITGVQIESGTQATSFEYRQYQQELALCQRYFYATSVKPLGIANTTSNTYQIGTNLPVTMRGTPTLSAVPTAVFVVSAGTAGTPALNPNATAGTTNPDWAALYNSAANWTAGSYVAFTGGLSAEL